MHLEICSDAGARYAVQRPRGGPHKVIDLDEDRDVTSAFTSPDGRVNVLERAGLDVRSAKAAMRVTSSDLTTRSEAEERILTLAHVDQGRLWDVAAKVKDRDSIVGKITFDDHGQNTVPVITKYVVQDGKFVEWDDSEYASGKRKLPGQK